MNQRLTDAEWNDLMKGFQDDYHPGTSSGGHDNGQKRREKLEMILDIPVKGEVIIGRTERRLKDLLQLEAGMIIETENVLSNLVELQVNKQVIALGEVVVVGENYGIRIKQVIPAEQIVQKLV